MIKHFLFRIHSLYNPSMAKVSKFDIDAPDIVKSVAFSPYEWSSELLAYGAGHHVIVERCKIVENEVSVMSFSNKIKIGYKTALLILTNVP